MKAIVQNEFGDVDVLLFQDVPDPLVGRDQILVRNKAIGVNPVDWKTRAGYLKNDLPHYFPLTIGWDAAGEVVSVGSAVEGFAPGDEVMGYLRKDYIQHGTYAELTAAPDRGLAHKPAGIDFAQAAALPLAGLTALQALKAVNVGKGDTVLVHAASGGVGHLAVQIARELGATKIIGTASERNRDFVQSLGAQPIPYGAGLREALAEAVDGDGKVDAVIDLVGGEALEISPTLVHDPTRHVSIVDSKAVHDQGGKYVFVKPNVEQLSWLGKLAADGRLHVEIQQSFPLAQAADAHRLLEQGHTRGKLVLTV